MARSHKVHYNMKSRKTGKKTAKRLKKNYEVLKALK